MKLVKEFTAKLMEFPELRRTRGKFLAEFIEEFPMKLKKFSVELQEGFSTMPLPDDFLVELLEYFSTIVLELFPMKPPAFTSGRIFDLAPIEFSDKTPRKISNGYFWSIFGEIPEDFRMVLLEKFPLRPVEKCRKIPVKIPEEFSVKLFEAFPVELLARIYSGTLKKCKRNS